MNAPARHRHHLRWPAQNQHVAPAGAVQVMTGVGELTEKVKENPSLLLRRPKESKDTAKDSRDARDAAKK